MILKAAIKYKLLEWALDAFVSKIFYAFDILKSEENGLKVGQKFKELHCSGAYFYHVTVVGSSFLETKSGGWHFIYKYVKYNNSVTIQSSVSGYMNSLEEEEFYDIFQIHDIDEALDDIELYVPLIDLEKAKYIPY